MHFGSRHFIIKSITSRIPLGLSVILRTVSAINTSLHEGYPWLAWTHTVNIQTGQKYLGNNFPAEDRPSAMPDTCWIACFLLPFHLATTQLRHAFYVISQSVPSGLLPVMGCVMDFSWLQSLLCPYYLPSHLPMYVHHTSI